MQYKALLLLAIAVALGGVAAWLVNTSLNRQLTAQEDPPPPDVQAAVVAALALPVGTDIEAVHLRVVEFPRDTVPAGSFSTKEDVLELESAIVISEMQPGEFVLPYRLSSGVAKSGLTARIPDGYRAASIPVDEVRGVGGFVLPGDEVDVLHTTTIGRRDERPVTRTLLHGLSVLGVNQVSAEDSEDPIIGKVVTLLVEPEQAKTLTLAQQVGQLTLSLRNEGDGGKDESTTVALSDLWEFDSEDLRLPVSSSAEPQATKRSIQIIRGLDVRAETVASADDALSQTVAAN
ncbi:MAG: Flp pilus assembly protein CpaB [Pseudohongiellaceae bacterium]